jgi:hypothetical protein
MSNANVVTMEVGEDLSGGNGKAVKISGGKVVASAAAANVSFGVLTRDAEDSDTSGNYVPVCVSGECYGTAGAAVAIGALLISDSAGKLITTTATTDFIVGIALEAADATGDRILINVNLSNVGGS